MKTFLSAFTIFLLSFFVLSAQEETNDDTKKQLAPPAESNEKSSKTEDSDPIEDSKKSEPSKPEQKKAEQEKPEQKKAEPSKPEQKKAEQEKPEKKPVSRVRPIRYVFYSGIRYVLVYDVADYYRLASKYTTQGIVLYSKYQRIEMFYDKREGSINGVKTFFLAPVLYLDKRPYITENDFLKVIDPALRKKMIRKHAIRTIMIDPGHGGTDPGAPGPVLAEKQINLLIGLKLKRALEKLGFKVIMTRTADTFPTLSARSEMCKRRKPDLFISIHCNSAGNSSVRGVETYLLTPPKAASTIDKDPQPTVYQANTFDCNNFRFAFELQKAILKFAPGSDRGVRHARFYVLRNATCPAALIECGFLSNPTDGRQLATNEQQNKIVAAVLTGITRYSQTIRAK